ncbi:MAG: proton extrusion protein PcxA [Synechococcales cyanobacterium RM1_1_8]|nr:proton extrusion protein PcxA [Synechococcales cyanobacterium RM1_1_8]
MKSSSVLNQLGRAFAGLRGWVDRTPDRALEQAYEAILKIQAIEDEHFDGKTLAPEVRDYSANVYNYFRSEISQQLRLARVRLGEFRTSQTFLKLSSPQAFGFEGDRPSDSRAEDSLARDGLILEKLQLIDATLDRYRILPPFASDARALVPLEPAAPSSSLSPLFAQAKPGERNGRGLNRPSASEGSRPGGSREGSRAGEGSRSGPGGPRQTSFVPRSILGTFDRLRRDLDPEAEQEVVQSFRISRAQTALAARFVLILVIVPLLTHHLSKAFVVGPAVDYFRRDRPEQVFINGEMEEEAFGEIQRVRDRLEFKMLTHQIPRLGESELEERMELEAAEVYRAFQGRGSDAIKNVFSDLLAVLAFVVILVTSNRQIAILKTFMDELIYGLSDSAKAFIIILFTDMFVGFHSPHGWEVILEGVARHFGLPESRSFIFLFIATFPVILDTVFKYWIFRYLNRISPSAVATYRNMNE